MKFNSHFQYKRKKTSKRPRRKSSEPTGLITSSVIACGIGLLCGLSVTLILSLVSLLCGFGSAVINALGYVAAVISFAVCGFVAGKRGRAAIPSGILAACGMTIISVMLSFLPLSTESTLPPIAGIFVRLGLAAISVIFSVIGSNR